ncbi:MAG: DUF4440 domain-containing protein [Ginsengibacter sp.]
MLVVRDFSFLLLILVSFLFSSCNEQDKIEIQKSASAFDIKQGEASILQSNQHFMKSFEGGDSVTVSNCYTQDAKLMVPNQPAIIGRDNIVHFFSRLMKKDIADFDLHTTNIWGDSSILAEEGIYRASGKKNNVIDKGKYIVLWKTEAGNWKMYRDIWASDLPDSAIQKKKIGMLKK